MKTSTFTLLLSFTLLLGCARIPDQVTPVEPFNLNQYLGKWYEIARLDHPFERGLSNVTATYTLRDDGGVAVVNRGYDTAEGEWKESTGKAYFVEDPQKGFLKVSFFGPFYGSYIVIELDQEAYQYALVCGPNTSYLWLLARTPELDPQIQQQLIAKATALGFPTEELIYVDHKPITPPQ